MKKSLLNELAEVQKENIDLQRVSKYFLFNNIFILFYYLTGSSKERK